jgi:hypothetical protein
VLLPSTVEICAKHFVQADAAKAKLAPLALSSAKSKNYKYLPPLPDVSTSFFFLLHTYLIGVAALMNAVHDRFGCPLHIGLDESIQHPSGF